MLKKIRCLSSEKASKPKEKVIIISELRHKYKLDKLLTLANIPRSTFYYHTTNLSKDKYAIEKQVILNIFNENKSRYGYRRILIGIKKFRLQNQSQNSSKTNEISKHSR